LPSDIEEISMAADSMTATDFLVFSGLSSSKSDARRLIEQGGMKVDGKKVSAFDEVIEIIDGLVVQAGKRRFIKIKRS
jgi:tyrosyl-tRNA synthetase